MYTGRGIVLIDDGRGYVKEKVGQRARESPTDIQEADEEESNRAVDQNDHDRDDMVAL